MLGAVEQPLPLAVLDVLRLVVALLHLLAQVALLDVEAIGLEARTFEHGEEEVETVVERRGQAVDGGGAAGVAGGAAELGG